MNVVIYCRVSTEEQATKDLSIPSQRKELLQFAAKNGFIVVQEFVDEGFSAYADAVSRPEFQSMMRYCHTAKVGAVLVWKFDRFSRRMEDARLYKSMLARKKVKVISINEPISDDPAGFATERLLEMFAELYSRMLGVDTRRGLRAKAERGMWYGGKAAYGYRLEQIVVNGHERTSLVLGPAHEVETVQSIFRWALEDRLGGNRIATRLNDAGTRGPIELWRPGTVTKILRNPVYAGYLDYGRSRKKEDDDPGLIQGIHPAMVSLDEWKTVQTMLVTRHPRSERREVSSPYLLTGLLWCWCQHRSCGTYSKNRFGSEYYAYCCTAAKFGIVCDGQRLQMASLNAIVLMQLDQSLEGAILDQMATELEELYQAKRAEYQVVSTTASKRMAVSQKIVRLYDAIEQGVDVLECSKRIAQYKRELESLIDEDVESKLESLERARETILRQLNTLKTRETSLLELPPPVQRELVLTFVERVEITREGIKVTIKYSGGGDGGSGGEGRENWRVEGGQRRAAPSFMNRNPLGSGLVKGLCPFTLPHKGAELP